MRAGRGKPGHRRPEKETPPMRLTKSMVEAAAKALYRMDGGDWKEEGDDFKAEYRRCARVALKPVMKMIREDRKE